MEALRQDSAYSHNLRGRIERFRGSSTGAAAHWERALAVDPNHLNSMVWLVGAYAIQAGKPNLADHLVQRLSEIDPLTPLTVFVVGMYHWMAGRLEEAMSAFERADALDSSGFFLHPMIAYVLVWQDRREHALGLLDQIIERDLAATLTEWARFLKHALLGEKSKALAALSEDVKHFLWLDPEAQWLATSTYALLGEKDEARRWFQHCIDRGWINYPVFSRQDPLLENVRDEKWFKEMMSSVRRDWEAFGAEREADA
jgi:non-specific serine/threonine protein kinase